MCTAPQRSPHHHQRAVGLQQGQIAGQVVLGCGVGRGCLDSGVWIQWSMSLITGSWAGRAWLQRQTEGCGVFEKTRVVRMQDPSEQASARFAIRGKAGAR